MKSPCRGDPVPLAVAFEKLFTRGKVFREDVLERVYESVRVGRKSWKTRQEGYEIRRVRSSSPFGPPSGQQPVLVSRFSSPARPSVIDGPTTLHPGQRKSGAILTTRAPRTHEKAQGQRPDGPPIRMRNSRETHAHATSLNIAAKREGPIEENRADRRLPVAARASITIKIRPGLSLFTFHRANRTNFVGRSTKGQSTERSVPSYVSIKVVLYIPSL